MGCTSQIHQDVLSFAHVVAIVCLRRKTNTPSQTIIATEVIQPTCPTWCLSPSVKASQQSGFVSAEEDLHAP